MKIYAVLLADGQMTDLGAGVQPEAINGSGVVGQVSGHAFIYSGGVIQDLNSLIPPGSGYQLEDADGIDDNGQIVVNAVPTNGPTNQTHTLLLTP